MDHQTIPAILQVLLLIWACQEVKSANILMSGFMGKGSHFLCLVPIGKSLVRQGHNVSFLVSDEHTERAKDPELQKLFHFEIYKNTDPDFSTKEYFQLIEELGFSEKGGIVSLFKTMSTYSTLLRKTCEFVFQDEEMMKRFEKVDAIVSDIGWPCAALLKLYLEKNSKTNHQVRLIWSTPTTPNVAMLETSGSPVNPAYQPALMTSYTSNMTFIERTLNTIATNAMRVFIQLAGNEFTLFDKRFGLEEEVATLDYSFVKITDLVLGNFDFAIEYPFATTPSMISVGGLTAGPPNKLSQELEDFIQSSGDDGIVVFSLGTYFANFAISRPQRLKMFIDALAQIPQKVIMQLKVMPEYDLPPNIKALPWLPQNDLLGHPKTRLFVYHGGNNGFYEAVYHGVPIIVIPFFADQLDTAARIVSHGIGLQLDKFSLSVENIHHHLTAVLGDQKYSLAAKRLSAILRDRPMTPADRAAFWIDHVVKHGGDYMRSPVGDLSFIQYNLIDVYAFLASIVALFLFAFYKMMRCCISCCCGKKESRKSKRD